MTKSKFKVGDLIEAIEFDGATGRLLVPGKIYRVSVVAVVGDRDKEGLLTLDGERNMSDEPLRAYDRRFILHNLEKMDASEYEEIMEFERLVNG